jgi:diguanylate cyclase (GGDEF)-like protein
MWRMSLGSPLVLRYPFFSTLIISAIISGIAVVLSVVSYEWIGQHDPGASYEAVSALGIAGVLAPTFLYPWIRTAVRLRRASVELAQVANTDALTGLENRTAFRSFVAEALTREGPHDLCAILFIDLDQFKQVNDTFGHAVGDALLVAVANRLLGLMGADDHIARLGGDEFVILQGALHSKAEAASFARSVLSALSPPFGIDGHQLVIGASVGIALAPDDGKEVSLLLRHADMALYLAKGKREGSLRFFEPQMATASFARHKIESDLRAAFYNGTLEVDFQPIVSLKSMRPTSCEALIRWPTGDDGMKLPTQFIPVAEEMGIMSDIGAWVLMQACRECSKWPTDVHVSVNLPPAQFRQGNLHLVIAEALAAAGLPPARLEVEITESVLSQNFSTARTTLCQLRAMGICISLDDFGTGYYSGLGCLHAVPVDKIKVDRSFSQNLFNDSRSLKLLRGIAKLSSELGIAIAVKGIETQEQADLIAAEAEIDEVQGFLFSPAVSARRIQELLVPYRRVGSLSSGRSHLTN